MVSSSTVMAPTAISAATTAVSSHSETHLVDAIKTDDVSSSPVPLVPGTAYYITDPPATAALEHGTDHPEPAIICGN